MKSADHVIVEHIAGVEDYQVAFVTERSFCEPPGADVREVELTIDFRESCHKQGISSVVSGSLQNARVGLGCYPTGYPVTPNPSVSTRILQKSSDADHQAIEQPERYRRQHEEVDCRDTIGMIGQKGPPALRWRPTPVHIACDLASLQPICAQCLRRRFVKEITLLRAAWL